MGRAGRGGNLKKLRIAFYLWAKGYFKKEKLEYFPNFGPNDKEIIPTINERIPRRTFPDYCNEDWLEAFQMWRDWQTFGFEHSGGRLDQGALWTDVIRTMQFCADKMGVQ